MILMSKSCLVHVASMRLVYTCTYKWYMARMPSTYLNSIMYEDWRTAWRIRWNSIQRCNYRRMKVEGVTSDLLCMLMKAMVLWRRMGKSVATSAASCIMISLWTNSCILWWASISTESWRIMATVRRPNLFYSPRKKDDYIFWLWSQHCGRQIIERRINQL